MIDLPATNPFGRAVGLALVEFVWQGALLGLLAATALWMLRRAAPQTRYVTGCVALVVMCAAPIATVITHLGEASAPAATVLDDLQGLPEPSSAAFGAAPVSESIASPGGRSRWSWIETQLPVVLLSWIAGVFVMISRLAREWFRMRLVRTSARPVPHESLLQRFHAMAERAGSLRNAALRISDRIDVPSVIGWMKPVILVPASALSGLTPAHLDAILAHELAHVRRGDYLVNMLQCVAETLLFYHPAIWWVSRQIRRERELCCDDLASSWCGDRLTYAGALASLEELRVVNSSLAVAANGGELLERVRRLVEPTAVGRQTGSGGLIMSAFLVALLFFVNGPSNRVSALDLVPPPGPAWVAVSPGPTLIPAAPASPPAVLPAPAAVGKAETPREPQQDAPIAPQAATGGGSISGTVRDMQGGVIPGAYVAAAAVDPTRPTPEPRWGIRVVTDGTGSFNFRLLPAGTYDLTTSMDGFRTLRNRVTVQPNQPTAVEIRLQVGSVSESILVTGPLAPVAGQTPRENPADYFDLARRYYEAGRLLDAEAMTLAALNAMRAQAPAPAAVSTSSTGAIRVGGDIRPPSKVLDANPIYPAAALAARTQGTVYLDATIGVDGTVQHVSVIRGVPGLDRAALDAVSQWRYTPTLLNGQPVEVSMAVSVTFTLP